MARTIKIDFYRTIDPDGNSLDIAEVILRASGLPLENRRVDIGEDAFICLHNVRRHRGNVVGEVLRGRMTELPDKVSRERALPEDLGLQADEGIGHRAHFCYDPRNRVLLFQRSRDVRSTAFISSVADPTNVAFSLALIYKRDAMNRLGQLRVVKKIAFTVAAAGGVRAVRDENTSASRAIDLLNDVRGRQMEINISVGRAHEAGLERNSVMELARWLFGRRGRDVERVTVSGKENLDASVETIDLLQDRFVHEIVFPGRVRRIDHAAIEEAIIAAHAEKIDEVRGLE